MLLQVVYEYVELIDCVGFVFMDLFGYDLVVVMGQIVSGVNFICFIMGCGLMFGFKFVLMIKFVSNMFMFCRFEEDMDINCGCIFDGECLVEEMG